MRDFYDQNLEVHYKSETPINPVQQGRLIKLVADSFEHDIEYYTAGDSELIVFFTNP